MWLWEFDLRRLGFRQLSERYRQGQRRYGLPGNAYISIFSHAEERPGLDESNGELHNISAFHVTFCLGVDRIHFYYHEIDENTWEPGGHTSSVEIRRYRRDPAELRSLADQIASEFLSALGRHLTSREC